MDRRDFLKVAGGCALASNSLLAVDNIEHPAWATFEL